MLVDGVKRSMRNSEGKIINDNIPNIQNFWRWFGDSKAVDEEGRPLVVYHGSDSDFDVFDISKGRTNMDIQGSFFSPYELDAKGYGSNVRAFYLKIENPSKFRESYKALNKYQGQKGAGIKAREDLKKQRFDGVNNDNEEYIVFDNTQIKSVDNRGTFDPKDPKHLSSRQ